jgi:spermidine/putrescine transport system substrate-binding protein
MFRTKFFAIALAAMLVLSACGGGGSTSQPSTSAPSDSGTASNEPLVLDGVEIDRSKLASTLYVYNWSDYMDTQVLDMFTAEYGVDVVLDIYDSNEDMIGKVRPKNSGYDVVFPSDYAVDIMAQEGLLAELDKSLLPNIQYMNPNYMDLYYDKGNKYSLPYTVGTSGIAYDATKIEGDLDSWSIVFDPAQANALPGQFSMLDDAREVPGAALRYLGKSVNDASPEALAELEALLKAQKASTNLASYDSSNVSRNLASGSIVLGHIYSSTALQAFLGLEGDDGFPGNENLRYFVPKEGAVIWQDNVAILAESKNQYTANLFLNFLMRPEISLINLEYILSVTPNVETEKMMSDELRVLFEDHGFGITDDMIDRLEWLERNEESAAFDDLWTAVKGE